jgi:hypothetical protein
MNLHLTRHSGTFQTFYDLSDVMRIQRAEAAADPLPQGWVRAMLSRAGRALTNDDHRLTQEAAAGAYLSLVWEQFSHFAFHIGYDPAKLKYGTKINGIPLTQLLCASRQAYQHGMDWMVRDFKIDAQGKTNIRTLEAAGLSAIPFRADEALWLIAPDGAHALNLQLMKIARDLADMAIKRTTPLSRRLTRKRPARKPASRKATARKPVAKRSRKQQ